MGLSSSIVKQGVTAERRLLEALFRQLAAGSRDEPGITRDTYGPGETFAHGLVVDTARELGLEIERDAAANSYMTLPGIDRGAPRVIIGSHLDSVRHGGNFDGAAGVVAGLAAIAVLKRLGLRPRCDVTVMGIRAEESAWFQVSYIGSRSALGVLPPDALEARRIDTGRRLADHMADCGGDPDALRRGDRFLDPCTIRAFAEIHIEQAPSLVEAGMAIGICTAIPGNFRYPNARIDGEYAHVGTPRRFRHDAALAGGDLAVALDRIWEQNEAAGRPMAMTFGRFHTDPAAHSMTIVPGEFHFSLDVRAYDGGHLAELERTLLEIVGAVEQRRGVRVHLGPRASAEVGTMAADIRASFAKGAQELGIPSIPLGSPGSHDAAAFAAAGVPTGMLFVRNTNGSHNPAEAMSLDDLMDAIAVLVWWLAANHCGSS